MKKIIFTVLATAMIAGFASCKKTAQEPGTENPSQFPSPTWVVDQTGKYPASMTAVVNLPPPLQANLLDADKLGAFVNDECRGEGTIITLDTTKVFFVLITGTPSEQSAVKFKYYSKKTSYMYESVTPLTFTVDDNFGTATKPETLNLAAVK